MGEKEANSEYDNLHNDQEEHLNDSGEGQQDSTTQSPPEKNDSIGHSGTESTNVGTGKYCSPSNDAAEEMKIMKNRQPLPPQNSDNMIADSPEFFNSEEPYSNEDSCKDENESINADSVRVDTKIPEGSIKHGINAYPKEKKIHLKHSGTICEEQRKLISIEPQSNHSRDEDQNQIVNELSDENSKESLLQSPNDNESSSLKLTNPENNNSCRKCAGPLSFNFNQICEFCLEEHSLLDEERIKVFQGTEQQEKEIPLGQLGPIFEKHESQINNQQSFEDIKLDEGKLGKNESIIDSLQSVVDEKPQSNQSVDEYQFQMANDFSEHNCKKSFLQSPNDNELPNLENNNSCLKCAGPLSFNLNQICEFCLEEHSLLDEERIIVSQGIEQQEKEIPLDQLGSIFEKHESQINNQQSFENPKLDEGKIDSMDQEPHSKQSRDEDQNQMVNELSEENSNDSFFQSPNDDESSSQKLTEPENDRSCRNCAEPLSFDDHKICKFCLDQHPLDEERIKISQGRKSKEKHIYLDQSESIYGEHKWQINYQQILENPELDGGELVKDECIDSLQSVMGRKPQSNQSVGEDQPKMVNELSEQAEVGIPESPRKKEKPGASLKSLHAQNFFSNIGNKICSYLQKINLQWEKAPYLVCKFIERLDYPSREIESMLKNLGSWINNKNNQENEKIIEKKNKKKQSFINSKEKLLEIFNPNRKEKCLKLFRKFVLFCLEDENIKYYVENSGQFKPIIKNGDSQTNSRYEVYKQKARSLTRKLNQRLNQTEN